MELEKKFPIILSAFVGIITIALCLNAKLDMIATAKNTVTLMLITLSLSFILKVYIDVKVFNKFEIETEQEEDPDSLLIHESEEEAAEEENTASPEELEKDEAHETEKEAYEEV